MASASVESYWDLRGGTFGIEGAFVGSESGLSSMAATKKLIRRLIERSEKEKQYRDGGKNTLNSLSIS